MILLALALLTPLTAEQRYERLTHGEFVCDDHPWRSRGCGLTRAERRLGRLGERICGPEGTVDMDPVPGHPDGWPHCNRSGWNGRRYGKRS